MAAGRRQLSGFTQIHTLLYPYPWHQAVKKARLHRKAAVFLYRSLMQQYPNSAQAETARAALAKMPAKVLGRSTSPITANAETTTPPMMNRRMSSRTISHPLPAVDLCQYRARKGKCHSSSRRGGLGR